MSLGSDEKPHFPLRKGARDVVLEADGFEHPRTPRGRGSVFSRYADLTHLAVSERFAWIATRRSLYLLPRSLFADAEGPERLVRALESRIQTRPGGAAQLERMARVEWLARRPMAPRATWTLAGLCVLGYLLQLTFRPEVSVVGSYSPRLFAEGDVWRIVTGNLMHGFPLHLALNLLGLLVLGRLVERMLGTARTACVMGASAVASMAVSGMVKPGEVVGVSGVVLGLAGALLWLELRRGEELPAWWRFPRHVLVLVIAAVLVDSGMGFVLPFVAAEAHLGGLLAGAAAAAVFTPRELYAPPPPVARRLAVVVVAAVALSIGAAAVELARGDFMVRHALRLAELPGVDPHDLNNSAWFIAIDPDSNRAELEAALHLAERAVAETDSHDAALLDTLAEVHFQLGHPDRAIAVIDQAIARQPDQAYYREQRRRFSGERAADDRPPDPILLPRQPPPVPPDEDGIRV